VWCSFAQKKPIKHNFNYGLMNQMQGLVLHITDGDHKTHKPGNLNGLWSTFNKQGAGKSAHFGISQKGEIWQFIDTDNRSWAVDGSDNDSHWLSVENIAMPGDALTDEQIDGVALILNWLHDNAGVPYDPADTRQSKGLGYHSMFHIGDHSSCPGPAVLAQRFKILRWAPDVVAMKDLLGRWLVTFDTGWSWYYTFYRGNSVSCTDIKNPPEIEDHGTWSREGDTLKILWRTSSEGWSLPVNPAAMRGQSRVGQGGLSAKKLP
jgi:hypothetical protein